MKIFTSATASAHHLENANAFWEMAKEEILGGADSPIRAMHKRFEGSAHASESAKCITQIMDAVRAEMVGDEEMLGSEISRYLYKSMKLFALHGPPIMRKFAEQYRSRLSVDEFEEDLRQVSAAYEDLLESRFRNELAYWKAMEEKNYGLAQTLLAAIDALRPATDVPKRVEVINWKLELSTLIGDTQGFVEAIIQALAFNGFINRDTIIHLVKRLLIARGFNRIMIMPSGDGIREGMRHEKGVRGFMQEQAAAISNSIVIQVADEILKKSPATVKEFDQLVAKATQDSRRASLAVNPYLREVIIPQI